MIEYIEIRSRTTRQIIGLIDSAESIIWHSEYYGTGDFEIYVAATPVHIALLKEGNYITRPDEFPKAIGVIEGIESENTISKGKMIIARGRFAKSILDRRHIYRLSGKTNRATILSGNVEVAVRKVVTNNIINCPFDANRNIDFLKLGTLGNFPQIIVDDEGNAAEKQVSFENLLEYTDAVLQEYKLGAEVLLAENLELKYTIISGKERTYNNEAGNEPVIFSQEYDNLFNSNYEHNSQPEKTAALIGGEGEGLKRFYTLIAGSKTGIERREMWVDASSISKTYQDEDTEEEHIYTDSEYRALLKQEGKRELSEAKAEESYEAAINELGKWKLDEHYFLGDVVTFQDNALDKYINVRIIGITEVQDENGYSITPAFDFEGDS